MLKYLLKTNEIFKYSIKKFIYPKMSKYLFTLHAWACKVNIYENSQKIFFNFCQNLKIAQNGYLITFGPFAQSNERNPKYLCKYF